MESNSDPVADTKANLDGPKDVAVRSEDRPATGTGVSPAESAEKAADRADQMSHADDAGTLARATDSDVDNFGVPNRGADVERGAS